MSCRTRDERLHRTFDPHSPPEDVVTIPLDAAQRLEVHGPHDLGRHQPAAILVWPGQDGALIKIARACALERHQAAHRFGHDAFRQIVHVTAVRGKVLERQIHAASREVVGDVAQDVRELEGDAEVDGVIPGPVVPAAEDPDADETHRRGDAAAILVEIGERLVARGVEVHRDAVDDIVERLTRQVEGRDEGLEVLSLRRGRRGSVERARELGAPEGHGLAAGRIVGRVVFSSTASSTARQKSQTATIACRCSAGRTRNE